MRKGQTLLELALALAFLMLILAGLVDYGRLHSVRIALINAAREGAFFAASDPDNLRGAMDRVKQEAMTAGIALSDSDISLQIPTGENQTGQPVSVTIQTSVPTIFARFIGVSAIPITVQATAPMMR